VAVWQWLLDAAGALLFLLLAYGVLLVARRRWISRSGGTFELAARIDTPVRGRGWVLGLGRYYGADLQWFRIFSLGLRPKRTWPRAELGYSTQRPPTRNESISLYAGHVVVVCDTPDGPVELAMSPSALTGLQSWLEAGPPGTGDRGVVAG
jgi:hypothetical protein